MNGEFSFILILSLLFLHILTIQPTVEEHEELV